MISQAVAELLDPAQLSPSPWHASGSVGAPDSCPRGSQVLTEAVKNGRHVQLSTTALV